TYIIMFTSSMIYSTLSLYMSDKVKIISGLSKCVCKASINIKSGVDNTPATLISTIFERFSFNNSQEIRLSNTATSNQFRKVVLYVLLTIIYPFHEQSISCKFSIDFSNTLVKVINSHRTVLHCKIRHVVVVF